jgi:hypothetical protein
MKPVYWTAFAVLTALNLHHAVTIPMPQDSRSEQAETTGTPVAETPKFQPAIVRKSRATQRPAIALRHRSDLALMSVGQ